MKHPSNLMTLALVLCAGLLAAPAAETKSTGGPKGGRILAKTTPKAEFYVQKDRTVIIAFYDAAMKPVAAASQSVIVIAGAQDHKARLEFEKKGDVLASKGTLPEGDGYQVVVQFKETAQSKPQNYRFKLDLHTCGECKRAEYACTCDH